MTKLELYIIYRKIQSEKLLKNYKIPDNFDKWLLKQKPETQEYITTLTGYFNTKYHNLDPELYIRCGFEIWKNFTYHQFLNDKVLKLYKIKDKNYKIDCDDFKKSFVKSVKHILKIIKCKECNTISDYFDKYSKLDDCRRPIHDYLKNKICRYMITYLIMDDYLTIDNFDKNYLSLIKNNYDKYVKEIHTNRVYIKELFDKINIKLKEIK